nr:FkbM family methyltransferase [Candidatus Njordarchaeum guaymaensis]
MGKGADFRWLRKQVKDEESMERINEIEKDHHLVFEEGKIIKNKKLFDVNLGKYKIWFRKGGACSSIDIYTEIFKENDHLLIPEFSGKEDKIVLDLGANEGYYTLKIKQNNPECKIVSVEPNPLAFEALEKNVKSNNLKDVILVNKAVTTKTGKMLLEIVPEISAIGAKEIRAQKRPWLKEERIKKITVDGTTLPQLCKECDIDIIDILKMDVEGQEVEILESSKDLLKDIKRIVVEHHGEKS